MGASAPRFARLACHVIRGLGELPRASSNVKNCPYRANLKSVQSFDATLGPTLTGYQLTTTQSIE
jgi:hypothetical protein